ncbi:MAG: hypothetical protein RLZZ342_477 [Candidatus Parcubacteria bacterium]|jgi:DNA-binding MarR family transcriptional regulator
MSVGHKLHRVSQIADEAFAAAAAESEVTPRQYAVLQAIADSERPSQTALVEKTGIDRSTLADIVRRLVSKGLIQRRRTREDARAYAVSLTDKGHAILRNQGPAKAANTRILGALSRGEQAQFEAMLDKIIGWTAPTK